DSASHYRCVLGGRASHHETEPVTHTWPFRHITPGAHGVTDPSTSLSYTELIPPRTSLASRVRAPRTSRPGSRRARPRIARRASAERHSRRHSAPRPRGAHLPGERLQSAPGARASRTDR